MEAILFLIFYIAFILLSILMHELGHLIFGLATGYSFSSFRLLSFVWLKENGKIVFKKTKSILLGQCLMTPPNNERSFRFVGYNLGGGIINLLVTGVMFVALVYFYDNDITRPLFTAAVTANVIMGLMNVIPMNFGTPNDGMNVLMALQSAEARHGLFLMLHVNNETVNGKRYRDFDSGMFSIAETANCNNYFVACIVMCEATRLYDLGEYDESIAQYHRLDVDKLQTYYRNTINLDILYYNIIHKPDFEKARAIYSDKRMQAFCKLALPQTTRVLSAYEYYVLNDKDKGRRLLEKAKAATENYPNNGVKRMERDYCAALEELYARES